MKDESGFDLVLVDEGKPLNRAGKVRKKVRYVEKEWTTDFTQILPHGHNWFVFHKGKMVTLFYSLQEAQKFINKKNKIT